jgi:aryl-alcohol dehydrogenase-like predicted oxidoreductase
MRKVRLGRDGPEVSEICLGTMTWGSQNTAEEGHAQIERAAEAGCTFMDAAEMYPVNPVRAETVGRTEEIVGEWFAASGRRDDWVVATKMSGANGGFVRDGRGIEPEDLPAAVHGSLRRLRTDRIDLYQFHWPNRGSYHFRRAWSYDPTGQDRAGVRQHMEDVVGVLRGLVEAGDILHFGLSNDTAWGTVRWIDAAERGGGPRPVSVQNEYSLLCRLWDTDMAEMSHQEEVALLAFSPLGAGLLSGKYQGGAVPEGSRMAINGDLGGRRTERVFPAVDAYLEVAGRHGLDPVHLAVGFCLSRPFPVVPIVGATDLEQLDRALSARPLPQEVLDDVAGAHRAHPMPF